MELQRVLAKDSRAAMDQVHKLYGQDALVISNKRAKNKTELIVAVDLKSGADEALEEIQVQTKKSSHKGMTAPITSFDEVMESKIFATEDVTIEDDVVIMHGVFIGKGSKIGKGTIIYPNVSIYDQVEVGANSIIHSGVVIGSDGLGFAKDAGNWVKIEHIGKVIIGQAVELGSNTTIDRGSVGNTIIEDNVKIDNQVHIAHNVEVGSGTAIAANSAIAGSTKVGKNCTLAGCTAIVDNVEIADEVHITAKSLVTKSIKESGIYSSGTPFMKNSDWKKNAVGFKRLHELIKR